MHAKQLLHHGAALASLNTGANVVEAHYESVCAVRVTGVFIGSQLPTEPMWQRRKPRHKAVIIKESGFDFRSSDP